MAFCASCGLALRGDLWLCPHHHLVYGDEWAESNRIWCDFFHRGLVPGRLTETERDDNFWAKPRRAR
jgi:hypothetical protein